MYQLLKGCRIVEAAAFIAGPSCALHMAQMGADVIRIDPIGGGPDHGRWPLGPDAKSSLYWEGLNKGKRSVAIDLSHPEGRRLALALAAVPGEGAGMFVTNLPPRSFLSHEALAAIRPDMISLRIMGWPDGTPAVDYTINAAVGIPAMTGPADGPPVTNHVLPAWDLIAGAYGAFATVSALFRRRLTGEGAEIRLPLSDIASACLGHLGQVAETLSAGDRPRFGNDLFGAFGRDFLCGDGVRLMVVAITPKQWSSLIDTLALGAEVVRIERETGADFASDEGARFTHRARLFPLFEAAIAARSSSELGAEFARKGVTWSRYQTMREAVTSDPRLFGDNPVFQRLAHPSGLTYPSPGAAATLADEEREPVAAAPRLGEHTDEVLGSLLSLGEAEIGRLHDQGVVAGPAG